MKRIEIEVPATSANLGPGFDTLALALDITNTISVELDEDSTNVTLCDVTGDACFSADPEDNLVCRAYRAWNGDRDQTLPGARFSIEGRIPIERGFGSSAACIVAGLAAAAHAAEDRDARDRMLHLATELEGHADNVAAAIMGGVTVAFRNGSQVHALHVANHLALGVALFVPDEPLLTREARAALPRSVAMDDAVFDLGRLGYLTTALIWGRWDRIGAAMEDRLHQPYRARLLPGLNDVISSALQSGAYGASLSGGGPSVIALTPRAETEQVAAAMEACARERGWAGKSLVTGVREHGVTLKEVPESQEGDGENA